MMSSTAFDFAGLLAIIGFKRGAGDRVFPFLYVATAVVWR
jgi:hypothetical protein